MEIEGSNENVNTTNHHGARHCMALVEVVQSSGGTGPEISPNSELNENAPLHPGTRSWEVPRENIVTEKIIGKGAFGQVAQGKASQLRGREGTITVAIKMLKGTFCVLHNNRQECTFLVNFELWVNLYILDDATETERKDLLSELELMKTLKPHPYVVKLLGCVTESGKLYHKDPLLYKIVLQHSVTKSSVYWIPD